MRKAVSKRASIVLACLACAAGAHGIEQWIHEGLAGRTVTALAVAASNPGLLYAGTMAGEVFRFEDASGSWLPASSGLPGAAVHFLAVHPFDPLRVFAGTQQGLYRSGDAGGSWEVSGTGLPAAAVTALAIDPVDPAIVWVSTDEPGLLHVYRSSDGGDRWEAVTIQGPAFGTPNFGWVRTLAFRPGASTVFAGWGDVVFFSNDGAQWDKYPCVLALVLVVLPDPFDAALVYVGTQGRGVAASADNRAPWSFGAGVEGTIVPAVASDPAHAGLLYAVSGDSVFRSLDHGATWAPVGQPLSSPGALAVSPDGSEVRVGTADGVRRLVEGPVVSPRLPVDPIPALRSPLLLGPRG
jgi:hypothetical protein